MGIEHLGIKKLRNNPNGEKKFCKNCNCVRYGECGCMKAKGKEKD